MPEHQESDPAGKRSQYLLSPLLWHQRRQWTGRFLWRLQIYTTQELSLQIYKKLRQNLQRSDQDLKIGHGDLRARAGAPRQEIRMDFKRKTSGGFHWRMGVFTGMEESWTGIARYRRIALQWSHKAVWKFKKSRPAMESQLR
jgi:hypothetical protein